MQQLGSHWTDFSEILYEDFRKYVEKTQVLLKSDKNNGHFIWGPMNVYDISLNFSCNEKYFRKSCRKIKTHILGSKKVFLRKSCSLWDNVEKYGTAGQPTDDNIIWHMCLPCWIITTTHTHTYTHIIFNTYCFSVPTIVTQTHLNVTLYIYCVSCLVYQRQKENRKNIYITIMLQWIAVP
jgi:hypothetical protein